MAGLVGALSLLDQAYPRLTSSARLMAYGRNRLPPELRSIGDLRPMSSGSGRAPFALGDELVVKVARMPRGLKENSMEGDWLAPVPEAVFSTDDNTVAVVKRAPRITTPENKRLTNNLVKSIEQARREGYRDSLNARTNPSMDLRYSDKVQDALEEMEWSNLLNYDPLWGDFQPRNFGETRIPGTSTLRPLLTDAGALDINIMDVPTIRSLISPAEWASYRNDVLRAKKKGGLVQMREKSCRG